MPRESLNGETWISSRALQTRGRALAASDDTHHLLRKAFRIIRRNYGCPGMDGVSLRDVRRNFREHATALASELNTGSIVFHPPRHATIVTGGITPTRRDIYVYNIRERWLQCYIRLLTEPFIPALSGSVYSYRRGRTRSEGLEALLRAKPHFVLLLDIKSFFGSLCRKRLIQQITRAGVPDTLVRLIIGAIQHSSSGLPRGNGLSPLLANAYLAPLDALFPRAYVRFSDDLMFAVSSPGEAAQVRSDVRICLCGLGLELAEDKTRLFAAPFHGAMLLEYPWFAAPTVPM